MGSTQRMLRFAATLALAASVGCAPVGKPSEASADFAAFVLPALPDDAHPTLIDFGGKVHVVGYVVSPAGIAGPSEAVTVKLFWQRVGALEPGFQLFTHLEDDKERQLRNFDGQSALRAKIVAQKDGLALLELGKIYKDELTLEFPKANELTPEVSLMVGVFNQKLYDETDRRQNMRLPVLSGSTNGHDAAIVANFATGVGRQQAVALKGSRP